MMKLVKLRVENLVQGKADTGLVWEPMIPFRENMKTLIPEGCRYFWELAAHGS